MTDERKQRVHNLADQLVELLSDSNDSVLVKVDAMAIALGHTLLDVRKDARKSVTSGAVDVVKMLAAL